MRRSRALKRSCRAVCHIPSPTLCCLQSHNQATLHQLKNIAWNEKNNSGELGKIRKQQWQNSPVEITFSHPLNISYFYLAGTAPKSRKFLSIGISTVKRVRENYLMDTLQSIFERSSYEELEQMVVVIYLADFDVSWNLKTTEEIKAKFTSHISAGHLLVIQCSKHIYPRLAGLKRNYNDPQERVQFRSKQNVDYAFLVNFCSELSDYYLMLEDDVFCAKNFLSSMKKFINLSKGSSWTTLTFSKLGYIGKLYHSVDLPKLARFLLMFYDEMPCDWLLELFHRSKAQPNEMRFKPSLFQHMGTYSSFQGKHNKLKDDEFQEHMGSLPDNPPALVFTDIPVYEQYLPAKAYELGVGQFWGKSLKEGNYFLVVFEHPVKVSKICVLTGSPEHKGDILRSGILQVGRDKATENDHQGCKTYSQLGTFDAGRFEMENVTNHFSEAMECVRALVTEDQTDWLIISEVNIWIEKEK
ncbi:alpha-1,3-mannosyl-glycoprotein 4-beta-N-acetylglucosaminyltransferase C-like [Rhincodon typus]|uniref:alpha-1,3-mannosyl-glycoprotein 4-beta-N-acetylglucosaminyltransferase C-like n=1 Tax=Rhincodon typus TaxID=259920 RepID=UPI00202F642A|nr:alpha-1,3-mannosyl-glycoprotein 4-beta-N-acetylglucosaminyltransferase C-like [Rhincodon typus]